MNRLEHNMARSTELMREAQRGGLDFVRTELEMALTFAKLAREAREDSKKRARNLANARKAYESALHWRQRFGETEPMQHDLQELEPGFQQVKSELEQLGELL